LMATMLNGAAIMDAALLVIAANQPCPSPQTVEHLSAVELMGLRNIIVLQNKVDLLAKADLFQNYKEIRHFLKDTAIAKAPILPVCAQQSWNMDSLCRSLAEMPVPERDVTSDPLMMVVRSFDVNKPGEDDIDNLRGAVVGGSLIRGQIAIGQTVEMRPGRLEKTSVPGKYKVRPVRTKIISLFSDKAELQIALPGGLIALGTTLDPSLGKADNLVGQVFGLPGRMPKCYQTLVVSYMFIERVVDKETTSPVDGAEILTSKPLTAKRQPFRKGQDVKLNIGSQTVSAIVKDMKVDLLRLHLTTPCCAEINSRVSISEKNNGNRWSLAAMGMIKHGTPLEELS